MVLGVYTRDRFGLDEQERNRDGSLRFIAVKREIGLDGTYIVDANVDRDHLNGRPLVAFRLNDEGGEIFYRLTSSNIERNLAIVMDGRVRSIQRFNPESATGEQ